MRRRGRWLDHLQANLAVNGVCDVRMFGVQRLAAGALLLLLAAAAPVPAATQRCDAVHFVANASVKTVSERDAVDGETPSGSAPFKGTQLQPAHPAPVVVACRCLPPFAEQYPAGKAPRASMPLSCAGLPLVGGRMHTVALALSHEWAACLEACHCGPTCEMHAQDVHARPSQHGGVHLAQPGPPAWRLVT